MNKRYRASAMVRFENISEYVEPIVESIATHDMTVEEAAGVHHIRSPFGTATFEATAKGFKLTAEANNAGGLNRLKHALVGPIGFIAAREKLEIRWEGDHAEPALPADLRILHVKSVEDIAPRVRRIVFRGKNLKRYDRDDQFHCRLIFQPRGTDEPRWPMLDHRGHVVWPDDKAVPTRVYTIRHIDAAAEEITIDFALHAHPGPATRWAMEARPGNLAGILGPAAMGPKPAEFHVLIGDETALPGIARVLESLPATAAGQAFIEVDSKADELPLRCPAGMAVVWLHRNGAAAGTTTLLEDAIRTVRWPDQLDRAFVWGGCEHRAFSAIHRHLKKELGLPRDRFVLYSHWHRHLSEEEIIAKGGEAYLPQ
ncbi:siderophore-interacting protein [Rhizobium sp. SSA_523]|uniref:siderophore-interacting protein n=1 Tax=Rhizobium sp. SSA_523 TaxID=2952477 RepID=UPI00209002E3|nr:siderophore-interacting protein [Rhizobium sp. SSA_523]MCO5733322.1 siderophore-interacting protein [Rhizobium sp. SSA_523]WKC21697.1 siderophore-interacting protein [Rhizobium sp. SSA_523]